MYLFGSYDIVSQHLKIFEPRRSSFISDVSSSLCSIDIALC